MAQQRVRIDIVSDVVCPWFIIGYKQLEQALAQLSDIVDADIHWHPFELNPMMAAAGQNLREHVAEKYGTSSDASYKARARLTAMGADLGFTFDYFDDMKIVNTFKAHQLLMFARQQGLEHPLEMRLFSAFFSERKDIGDTNILVAEAETVGLDALAAQEAIESERYGEAVRKDQNMWRARGVQAVPTFVIDSRYGVSGAQGVERWVDAFKRAYR